MTIWPGTCVGHEQFSAVELAALRRQHPDALVVAHPECPAAILEQSDFVGSTTALLDFVVRSDRRKFIIGTERHIIHQMEKGAPGKEFFPVPGADGTCNCSRCPFMELNTLEKLYLAMANGSPSIELEEELRLAALRPLQRMMDMSAGIGSRN